MTRLMMVIYSVAATTLALALIVVVLVMGWVTAQAIIAAAAIGVVLALPVSYLVARALY